MEDGIGGRSGDLRGQTLEGEHTIQYTDDGFWNCTHETYIMLLNNISDPNKFNEKENKWF